jgi:hypothetical protein
VPHPGARRRPAGAPTRPPHESIRNGTAKVLTLSHPADGRVRLAGVTACPNAVLRPWPQRELSAALAGLPERPPAAQASRAARERWQRGLSVKPTLPEELPPVRLLLVLDDLTGHRTPALVLWLFAHGLRPLDTPLSGSWLDLAESRQRLVKGRALAGQHPGSPEDIMAWFEAVAEPWHKAPTPLAWGGQRRQRRQGPRGRRHRLGGSGGYTSRPVARQTAGSYGQMQAK